jgi:hypothetical protein
MDGIVLKLHIHNKKPRILQSGADKYLVAFQRSYLNPASGFKKSESDY